MIACIITFVVSFVVFVILLLSLKFSGLGIPGSDKFFVKTDNRPICYAFGVFAMIGLILSFSIAVCSGSSLLTFRPPWAEANAEQYDEVVRLVEQYDSEYVWMIEKAKSDGKLSCWEYHWIVDHISSSERKKIDDEKHLRSKDEFVNLSLDAK
jgi:hypothetical protein